MLPNILSDYLNQVEQAIVQCPNLYVERYEEEILTSLRANLRIRLRLAQTHLLEINEAIVITDNQLKFLDYRYHFQDERNCLVFVMIVRRIFLISLHFRITSIYQMM